MVTKKQIEETKTAIIQAQINYNTNPNPSKYNFDLDFILANFAAECYVDAIPDFVDNKDKIKIGIVHYIKDLME